MIYQIYGVTLINGQKERRYYGDVDNNRPDEFADVETALGQIIHENDYAYAKQIGVGTIRFLANPHFRYPDTAIPLPERQ